MPLVSYKSKKEYESFCDFIERHIKKFKIIFIVFMFSSLTVLGASIACILNDNSVKGCLITFIIGVCGTVIVVGNYILKCIYCLYGKYMGEEEKELKDCSIYDMV